ncbi:MAG: T9SS type A sorting domain-containing protein [Chitinophagales bacterium]
MKKLFTVVLLFSVFAAAAQYPIGHISVNFKDASRSGGYTISGGTTFPSGGTGRTIGTEIYYPATSAGESTPVANGQFPVIVFGHGFAMGWDSYTTFYDSMARNGYIIALARTEGSLIPAPSHLDFGKDLANVAAQMITMNTTSGNLFFGKLNGREAIGGHSMGGGATFLADAYTNSNVKCYFTFAAAETNPSAVTAAAAITKPHLILSGTYDCVAPPATNQTLMYNALASSCKTQLNITKAYHCAFADNNFNCGFGEGTCITAGGLSSTLQQQIVRNYLGPYLDYYLKGVCPAWTKFQNMVDTATISAVTQSCTNTVPQSPNILGANYFCSGSSTLLTAYPFGFQYNWSNGASTSSINVSQAGNYSVDISNGVCSLTANAVNVQQKDKPANLTAFTHPDTVCSGISSLSFSVANDTNVTSYVWNFSNGWAINQGTGSSQVSVTSGNSVGQVTVYAENSCGTSDTLSATIAVLPSNLGAASAITGDTVACAGDTLQFSTSAINGATSYQWSYPSGWSLISPQGTLSVSLVANAAGGAVSVGGVNNCGVGVTSSSAISINSAPTPGTISGTDTICQGVSGNTDFQLNPAPTDGNIQWTLPNGWTTVSGQGTSALTVSNNGVGGQINCSVTNGCGTANFVAASLTVLDTPAVTIANNGTTLTASAAGATGYQWYFNGTVLTGETNATLTPTQSGTYYCVVNTAGNCSGSATSSFIYISVDDIQLAPFYFTNPVSNELEIYTQDFLSAKLAVYDLQGRLVMTNELKAAKSGYDVTALSAGVYLLQLQLKDQTFTRRITVQH